MLVCCTVLVRVATAVIRVVLEACCRGCTEVQHLGTIGHPGWVRPKMLAWPKHFQARLAPGDTGQNGHVVVVVGAAMILVLTDFMGFTVGRRGIFVLVWVFGRMLLLTWPHVCS